MEEAGPRGLVQNPDFGRQNNRAEVYNTTDTNAAATNVDAATTNVSTTTGGNS